PLRPNIKMYPSLPENYRNRNVDSIRFTHVQLHWKKMEARCPLAGIGRGALVGRLHELQSRLEKRGHAARFKRHGRPVGRFLAQRRESSYRLASLHRHEAGKWDFPRAFSCDLRQGVEVRL